MILLIAGQKGGVGKTTVAVSLATWRKREGRDVLLVDGDEQLNAATWAQRRAKLGAEVKVPCISIFGRGLANEVRDLEKRYDDIVIDVAGHKSEEFLTALQVANRVLTPVRASQFDLDTMVEVDGLVRMMRAVNPSLDAVWFVNQASTHASLKANSIRGTRTSLEDLKEIRPLDAHLCYRDAFSTTGNGYVIDETPKSDSRDKGVLELKRLAKEAWA